MSSWVNLLDILYPVGNIYFSTINASPATLIGGTWVQLTGGCLACAGTIGYAPAGAIGGSKKISVSQMPAHNHAIYFPNAATGANEVMKAMSDGTAAQSFESYTWPPTGSAGGGGDYIPYHISVYVWKRTA